jgi:hypothetical protein
MSKYLYILLYLSLGDTNPVLLFQTKIDLTPATPIMEDPCLPKHPHLPRH